MGIPPQRPGQGVVGAAAGSTFPRRNEAPGRRPEPPSAGAQWPARMAWLRKAAPSKAAPLFLGCKVLTSHPHSEDSEVLLAEPPGARGLPVVASPLPLPLPARLLLPFSRHESQEDVLLRVTSELASGDPHAKARTGAATVHVTPSSDLCSWGWGLNRYEHCSSRLVSSGCTVTNQQGQEQNRVTQASRQATAATG